MSLDKTKYKNIIFDLGGVILNIDYTLLINAFSNIELQHFEEHYSKAQQEHFFDLYEKGLISSQDFREQLKKYCAPETTNFEIDQAWNAMLLDLPSERIDLLKKLKTNHRTFLLSNTNEIHIRYINNYLQQESGITDLSGYFEKIYLSYQIQMRKPDAEIFELVLKENNLIAEETLFIDDSPQHIETAQKMGIQTYWLDVKKEDIVGVFN
jgi:FMN phosphatase YigB (HAD superfamily)